MKEAIENFVIEVLKAPETKKDPEMVAAITGLLEKTVLRH